MIDFCNSVIEVVKTSGWCKRGLKDNKGRSCLLGCIGRAAGIVTDKTIPGTDIYNAIRSWIASNKLLDAALRAECAVARTCGFDLLDNIIYYNDNKCFSGDDVIVFMEKVKVRIQNAT